MNFKLFLVFLLSIGSHFYFYLFSAIKSDIKEKYGISNQQYHFMIACSIVPNLAVPFIVGRYLMRIGYKSASLTSTLSILIGSIIALFADAQKSLLLLMFSRFIFGHLFQLIPGLEMEQ